jgi:hypothetical protein
MNQSDPYRYTLEALAVEGYREDKLTQRQVGELLGLTRIETEDFLAQHLDLYDLDPLELDAQCALLAEHIPTA